MINNTVTYTVNGREATTQITSAQPLSNPSAEQLVRLAHPTAIVTRVDSVGVA